jgi:serine/threonine protein kinase
MGNTKSKDNFNSDSIDMDKLYSSKTQTFQGINTRKNQLEKQRRIAQEKEQRHKLLKQGIEKGFDSQLMEKPEQKMIGKGMYGAVYKKQDKNFARKIPFLYQGEGIVSTIRNLKELQQSFQKNYSQSKTGENIYNLIVSQNEIDNYKYISKKDEIKEFFPSFIKSIGIVPYIVFLEGYITFTEFIKNPNNTRKSKIELAEKIIETLKKLHNNKFYHRDLYSLENIMIEEDTHNIKFIDLGISLNNDSIKNYSDDRLKTFLKQINEGWISPDYINFVNEYLTEGSTKTLPREQVYDILAETDIFMFKKSCKFYLNKK